MSDEKLNAILDEIAGLKSLILGVHVQSSLETIGIPT